MCNICKLGHVDDDKTGVNNMSIVEHGHGFHIGDMDMCRSRLCLESRNQIKATVQTLLK